MSRAQGINTGRAIRIGLVIGNGLVGLAGGLMAQYQGYSDVNSGRGVRSSSDLRPLSSEKSYSEPGITLLSSCAHQSQAQLSIS